MKTSTPRGTTEDKAGAGKQLRVVREISSGSSTLHTSCKTSYERPGIAFGCSFQVMLLAFEGSEGELSGSLYRIGKSS